MTSGRAGVASPPRAYSRAGGEPRRAAAPTTVVEEDDVAPAHMPTDAVAASAPALAVQRSTACTVPFGSMQPPQRVLVHWRRRARRCEAVALLHQPSPRRSARPWHCNRTRPGRTRGRAPRGALLEHDTRGVATDIAARRGALPGAHVRPPASNPVGDLGRFEVDALAEQELARRERASSSTVRLSAACRTTPGSRPQRGVVLEREAVRRDESSISIRRTCRGTDSQFAPRARDRGGPTRELDVTSRRSVLVEHVEKSSTRGVSSPRPAA